MNNNGNDDLSRLQHRVVNAVILIKLQHFDLALTGSAGDYHARFHGHQDRRRIRAVERVTFIGRFDHVAQIAVGLEAALTGIPPVFGLVRVPAARIETDVAAERAEITHMQGRHRLNRIAQRREAFGQQWVAGEVRQRARRADAQPAIRQFLNLLQLFQAIQADQVFRRLQTELHIHQHVGAAGHDPGLVPVLSQQGQSLGEVLRSDVIKWG